MKKYLKWSLIIFFLGIFFLLPVINSNSEYKTKSQKQEFDAFCKAHSCGLIKIDTPYQYVKESIYNIFFRKPMNPEMLQPLFKDGDCTKDKPCQLGN